MARRMAHRVARDCRAPSQAAKPSRCTPLAQVGAEALFGTGQLPKFQEDLFRLAEPLNGREAYLIPTAEVPITNLHAGEMLDEAALPLSYAGSTPCFRAEAGSHGKDTRGLFRQHQFHKVYAHPPPRPFGRDSPACCAASRPFTPPSHTSPGGADENLHAPTQSPAHSPAQSPAHSPQSLADLPPNLPRWSWSKSARPSSLTRSTTSSLRTLRRYCASSSFRTGR